MIQSQDFQFYPTPISLAMRMVDKIDWNDRVPVLDCSAGKGDLLDAVAFRSSSYFLDVLKDGKIFRDSNSRPTRIPSRRIENLDFEKLESYWSDSEVRAHIQNEVAHRARSLWAVEIDPNLQAVLRSKGYPVLGSDWLSYSGGEQPGVIVMNPPFAEGAAHLLRAIEYAFSAQICCILNAETLRNPFSLERQKLVKRLRELGASVEYISDAFLDAERSTPVEVALIYIDKRVAVEDSIFKGMDAANDHIHVGDLGSANQLVSSDRICAIVERYSALKQAGINLILDFYGKCGTIPFLRLTQEGVSDSLRSSMSPTEVVRVQTNTFIFNLRKKTWVELMDDPAIHKYMTAARKKEYLSALQSYSDLDVTEENLRSFVAHISAGYQDSLFESIEKAFDDLTYLHAYYEETQNNRHLYDGWKSNSAFAINAKVVLPNRIEFDSTFGRFSPYQSESNREYFNDLDKICAFFAGGMHDYISTAQTIVDGIRAGMSKKLQSTFFEISYFKKGTVHLRFLSEDVRRRFNIFCGVKRNFLPADYAQKEYSEMSAEERTMVDTFESKSSYKVDAMANPNVISGLLQGKSPLFSALEYSQANQAPPADPTQDAIEPICNELVQDASPTAALAVTPQASFPFEDVCLVS